MSRFNKFIDKAITKAKKWLPTVEVVYQAQSFSAISDSYSYAVSTQSGGDVVRIGKELTIKRADLIAVPEHGDALTIDGESFWAINDLNAGDTVVVVRAIDKRYHD